MKFLTKGKTNWKYILLVLILSIVVGASVLICSREEDDVLRSLPDIRIKRGAGRRTEAPDWKTYVNKEFGFTLKYPPSFIHSSSGPNEAQVRLDRGETISGSIQPSYDTVSFSEKDGGEQFRLEAFHPLEDPISEDSYGSHLYLYGPCDLRSGFDPEVITTFKINGINVLRVQSTKELQSCYYLKNYDNNVIVISSPSFRKISSFEEVNLMLEKVLRTLKLS